jgi:hypothetical protein
MKKYLAIGAVLVLAGVGLWAYTALASTLIDSYSYTNVSEYNNVGYYAILEGQVFENNANSNSLTSADFYIKASGTPAGSMYAVLYAITGTPGSNATPTGSVLATSASIDSTTLTSTPTLVSFTFSGANQYTLQPNTWYFIGLSFSDSNNTNSVGFGATFGSGLHPGNYYDDNNGADSFTTAVFYVYGNTVTNSCTYTSGGWNIKGTDHCYVTGSTYVTGACNFIGTGSLNLAGTISCASIHGAAGFEVNGKDGVGKLYVR